MIDRDAAPSTVGVLVKTFPKLSETFILGELLGLQRRGLMLHVFSLQRPTDRIVQGAFRELQARVSYAPGLRRGAMAAPFGAHLRLLMRRPSRYLAALAFAWRRRDGDNRRDVLRDFWQAGWLAGELKQAGIDHLHVHFINRPAGVAELVQRLSDISYSLSAHAKDIYLSAPETLQRRLACARFAVTCTEYNKRHLTRLATGMTPVVRLYHGIDLQRFRPAVAADCSGPPVILSVGRLREKKGFATLLRACAELRQLGIEFRCEIVGYGPDQPLLERLIQQLNLDRLVTLIGTMAHEQLVERYRRATLFVLPCQIGEDGDRDGIPNVLLEAMAMELGVLSTPISGIPEVIADGHNGLLVPPRQPTELARAMCTLLTDPQRRSRLGRAARLTVADRFTNEVNLSRLFDLLSATRRSQVQEVSAVAWRGSVCG